MVGAPTIVPLVGCRVLIAPVSYFQWLQGVVRGEILYHGITRGLSIPHRARGVKQEADNNPPAAYLTG